MGKSLMGLMGGVITGAMSGAALSGAAVSGVMTYDLIQHSEGLANLMARMYLPEIILTTAALGIGGICLGAGSAILLNQYIKESIAKKG